MDHLAQLLAELTCEDDARASNAAENLEELGEEAIRPLLHLLQNENADHRWWAVRALASFDDEQSSAGLIRSLSDAALDVRQCAAIALRKNPSTEAIGALIDAMQDQDRLLARLAGDALAAIGAGAIPTVAEILRRGKSTARGESARVLAKMEDQKTMAILFSALDDSSSIVRYWAEEGLNKLDVGMLFFEV